MSDQPGVPSLIALLGTEGYGDKILRDGPVAPFTTFNIGGPADLLMVAETRTQLVAWSRMARACQVPCTVLGGGSNILVADAGIRGMAIINATSGIQIRDGQRVQVDSGVPLAELASKCIDEGLAGLEWAVGVPGSLGGAVVGNAGAYGGCMAETVESAELLYPDGELGIVTNSELAYVYRSSMLKRIVRRSERPIVTRATLQLAPGDPKELRATAAENTAKRVSRTPKGQSAGSMFKRTMQYPAGYLIDQAGLKGYAIGDAMVSPVHANFLMNAGSATAQDMRRLIAHVQEVVWREFAQRLEPEVEFVGDWPDGEEH